LQQLFGGAKIANANAGSAEKTLSLIFRDTSFGEANAGEARNGFM
jgi:hypothetical protein